MYWTRWQVLRQWVVILFFGLHSEVFGCQTQAKKTERFKLHNIRNCCISAITVDYYINWLGLVDWGWLHELIKGKIYYKWDLTNITGHHHPSRVYRDVRLWWKQYLCSLCDELRGIKLCHYRLKDFIDNGGQDSLIVVLPQLLVHDRQVGCHGPRQHSHPYVHHLQIYTYTHTDVRNLCWEII